MGADSCNVEGQEMELFEDYLPIMAQALGEQDFMEELCKGFKLLADPATSTITPASLRKNASLLGLEELSEEELEAMVLEGDQDGDGALNENEFCLLMFRISPSLMAKAKEWVQDTIMDELEAYVDSFMDETS